MMKTKYFLIAFFVCTFFRCCTILCMEDKGIQVNTEPSELQIITTGKSYKPYKESAESFLQLLIL